jgi:EAL domain-containing protein (putative c-di-GMP-specific phosphodiesterase class I)
LLAHGCDQMQGFCYSRPVAPDAIEALLRAAPAVNSQQDHLTAAA